MVAKEDIADGDIVSRLVYEPTNVPPESTDFIWNKLFEFQTKDERKESLVWRKKCSTDLAVNKIGCQVESEKNKNLPDGKALKKYRGFLSGFVGEIRAKKIGNHKFSIEHAPDEGEWHVHIIFECNGNPTKNDRADCYTALEKLFTGFVAQSCPATLF